MNKKGQGLTILIVVLILLVIGGIGIVLEVTDVINVIPEKDIILNEPDSLQGFKDVLCNIKVENQETTKCHISEGKPTGNDLEIIWGDSIESVGEGDIVITDLAQENKVCSPFTLPSEAPDNFVLFCSRDKQFEILTTNKIKAIYDEVFK